MDTIRSWEIPAFAGMTYRGITVRAMVGGLGIPIRRTAPLIGPHAVALLSGIIIDEGLKALPSLIFTAKA